MNIENSYLKAVDIKKREIELIEEVKKLREENNLTTKDLEITSGVSKKTIKKLEDLSSSPRLNTIFKILSVYGYTLDIKKEK